MRPHTLKTIVLSIRIIILNRYIWITQIIFEKTFKPNKGSILLIIRL